MSEYSPVSTSNPAADNPDSLASRNTSLSRTGGIRGLVADYFREVAPTVEALKKAGFETRTDGTGETVFSMNGVWMSPASAARAGLI